jgi:para-nitrobenzyl esterase
MRIIKALIVLTVLLMAGCSAELSKESIRTLNQGEVIGVQGENGTFAWKGIPFAEPPLDNLRWKAPVAAGQWEGQFKADDFSESCFQRSSMFGASSDSEWSGSEDCLYLNVWSPQLSTDDALQVEKKLPVMMWIHGGGNTVGSATQYDPSLLASAHNVIVVTVQYRMGPLGWFRHPSLFDQESSLEDKSGNFGTLDNIMALKWINANIEQFGGDSTNVTVFGESAGGHNVAAIFASPLAEGFFHKAIVESGIVSDSSIDAAEAYLPADGIAPSISALEVLNRILVKEGLAENLSEARKVQNSMSKSEKQSILMNQPPEELLTASFDSSPKRDGMTRAYPDGHVIPEKGIQESFLNNSLNRVPIILGTNKDENKFFNSMNRNFVTWEKASAVYRVIGVKEMPSEIIDLDYYQALNFYGTAFWKQRAVDLPSRQLVGSGHKETYAYRFDWDELATVNDMDLSILIGSAHALEILFVMGTMDIALMKRFLFGDGAYPAAKKLSEQIQSYWAEFAYTGNPGKGRSGALPLWGSWSNEGNNKYMVLDSENDQGLFMSDIEYSKENILNWLIQDTRLSEKEKCELLYGLSYGDGNGVSKNEFDLFWNGRCSDKDYTEILNMIENVEISDEIFDNESEQ